MNVPLVLCYNLSPERAARIQTICLVQKLRLRTVAPAEYGEPIGALAGLFPAAGSPAPDFPADEEMLVLCGFPEPALHAFLQGFRKAGVAPVALKAVLTPTNANWNSVQLYQELRREHAAMTERPRG